MKLTVYAGGALGSLAATTEGCRFQIKRAPLRHLNLGVRKLKIQIAHFVCVFSRFDVVVLSWDLHYFYLPILVGLLRLTGRKVLLWGHGYSKREGAVRRSLRNFVGKLANGVIVYTRTTAKNLEERGGFNVDKVFVAQNAIDQTPIQNAIRSWAGKQRELADFRNRFHISDSSTAIFVSRLEYENRIDVALKALRFVRKEFVDANFVIIGDGPDRLRLEKLVTDLSLADAVHFAGAIYDEHELAPWMMSSALFCYPTNIGLSIQHAFGYGLPVITSDNIQSQNPEIESLRPGENGLLYNDGDERDLTDKWLKVLREPSFRKKLGKNAMSTAGEVYTIENMVEGFRSAILLQ